MLNPVEAKQLLCPIRQSSKKFNPWETKFLASVENQVDSGQYLSDAQDKVLQRLYRKSQGG